MLLKKSKSTLSLANLSKELLNIRVDKMYQVSSWKIRPLPIPMIKYGVADALLVIPVLG